MTPDEIVAGITHMRDTLEGRDREIQRLGALLKGCQEATRNYQSTNLRINEELIAAEAELRERRARFPA